MNLTPEKLKLGGVLIFLAVLGFFCADISMRALAYSVVVPPRAIVKTGSNTTVRGPAQTAENYVAATSSLLAPPAVAVTGPPSQSTAAPSSGPPSPWDDWLQDPQHNLTLVGTMVGSGLELAVILGNGQQYAIETGEPLGGWRVGSISDTEVTFIAPGSSSITTLTLPMLALASPSPAPITMMARQPLMAQAQTPILHVRRRGNTYIASRSEVDAAMLKPGGFTTGIRLDAMAKDNQPYGIKVNYLDQSNMLSYLGLQQGDVILSINDKDLRNQEDGIQAYLMLKSENSLNIKIDRNGRMMSVPVEIQ